MSLSSFGLLKAGALRAIDNRPYASKCLLLSQQRHVNAMRRMQKGPLFEASLYAYKHHTIPVLRFDPRH
jgi:hypothetical protein